MTTAYTDNSTGRRDLVLNLLWDVVASIVVFYGLDAMGVPEAPALFAAAAIAGLRMIWVAVRDRRLNAFATVMLIVWAIGLLMSFASGDPRFVLLKDSATTSAVGLAFLVSCAAGQPLAYYAGLQWDTAGRAELEHLVSTQPKFRNVFMIISLVWGFGLFFEAAVRVPLLYILPLDVNVALSTLLMLVTAGVLGVWNVWYVRRARERARVQDKVTANFDAMRREYL